jgi:hypothetical protein
MVRSVCDRRTGLFVLVLTLITVALPAPGSQPKPASAQPGGPFDHLASWGLVVATATTGT